MSESLYTSVLRAAEGENGAVDLIECLQKYPEAYNEIILWATSVHASRSISYHKEKAKKLGAFIRRLEDMGIKAGVDLHPTLGFFPPVIDVEMEAFPKHMNADGTINEGRLCIGSAETLQYVEQLYSIYAEINPSVIYSDDDIIGSQCYCPECIKKLEKRFHLFGDLEPTRENLNKLISSEDMETRKHARETVMRFNTECVSDVYRAMEKGVSSVNPRIELGLMNYLNGMEGTGTAAWIEILRGKTGRTVRMRPGGGVYTEFSNGKLLDKVNRVGAQIRYVPNDNTLIESEIENFPGQILRKTPRYTAFEALMYIACGCTGNTFSGTCCSSDVMQEQEAFFPISADLCKAGRILLDAFGREKPEGIGFWWDSFSGIALTVDEWSIMPEIIPFAEDMQQVGLPHCYDNENAKVFLLNKDNALQMTDEEIMDVFSKGVLMNAEALEVLNGRGFGKLTGFKVDGCYATHTSEKELSHRFHAPGEYIRNLYQGFDNSEFSNRNKAYALVKTDEKAEYLTEIYDCRYSGEFRGFGRGIFENELGGRIAIDGTLPFVLCYDLHRSVCMKNICRWLSRDTLSYVNSLHRVAMWKRGDAAYLANLAMDEAKNVELYFHTSNRKAEVTVFKGAEIIEQKIISASSSEGNYSVFDIPEIPIVGSALVKTI